MVKFCIILLITSLSISTAEMPYEDIEKAYYDSYAYEQKKDYMSAINVLKPVLNSYSNGYTVNFRMGWLSFLNGKYTDALKYYKRSLIIYPASVEVLNCIVLVYTSQENWKKVEEQCFQILKIDYFNIKANYWYAVALKIHKKFDLAENVSRKMLSVFPTSVPFLQELGEVLFYKKHYKEAEYMFYSVKILDPSNRTSVEFLSKIREINEEK